MTQDTRKSKIQRFCALQMKTVHTHFRKYLETLQRTEDLDGVLREIPDLLTDWWNDEPLDERDFKAIDILYDEIVSN